MLLKKQWIMAFLDSISYTKNLNFKIILSQRESYSRVKIAEVKNKPNFEFPLKEISSVEVELILFKIY